LMMDGEIRDMLTASWSRREPDALSHRWQPRGVRWYRWYGVPCPE